MKKIFLIIAILFQLNAVAQQPATGIEHVIVIGIDALSVEGLKKASTPNMDKLIRNGALCEHVRTVQPSSSAANWGGSMLMGSRNRDTRGVTNNDWRINDHSLKAVVVDKQGFFPTVLSVIRRSVQMPNWGG